MAREKPAVMAAGEGGGKGDRPVKWFVRDGAFAARATIVPGPEWGGWKARYDNDCERGKRATTDVAAFGPAIKAMLDNLCFPGTVAELHDAFGVCVQADSSMHGGGVHAMSPSGWLNCHLDYDRHPHFPTLRRAINVVAFLHPEWRPEWGGQFYLASPMGEPLVVIDPLPGRMVAFETNDLAYHGVTPISEDAAERVSLAVYYLAPAGANNTRRKAMFLPTRGGK